MNIFSKIKLLWKLKDPAEQLIEDLHEFKSGWRTWPFWVTVGSSVGSIVAALNGIIPAETSLILTTVGAGVYSWIRGMAKMDQDGKRPPFRSTEFALTVFTMVANILISLKDGGFDPAWMAQTQGALAAIQMVTQGMASHATEEAKQRAAQSNP